MYCIAILDSGNYAFYLCDLLNSERNVFDVISTPCRIVRSGCSYCIKLPCEFKNFLQEMARKNGINIREIFQIDDMSKIKYKKIH